MPDDVDDAQQREIAFRADSLGRYLHLPPLTPSSGVCGDCADPIEADRLAAMPTAKLCVGCANAAAVQADMRRRTGRRA